MKQQILITILILVLTISLMAQQKECKLKESNGISYLLSTPANYSSTGEAMPLLLFLHGSGERGNNLSLVKEWGPPKIVEKDKDFPFIVVSPQCPKGKTWDSEILKKLLDEVIENYNVDKSRICLTGLSMGGFGSFALAMSYPEYFAAVAPVCGGGNKADAFRMKNIPTWVFHGKLDEAVQYNESVIMVDELKRLGAEPLFTTLEEGGHVDAWVFAYNEAGLWEWFLKQRK